MNRKVRCRIEVSGVVQGVGFRPFIYSLACEQGLTGSVLNHSLGVSIEIEGSEEAVAGFPDLVRRHLPPLAVIDAMQAERIPVLHDREFSILTSESVSGGSTAAPPDVAICGECLRELFDPGDRRYRYPFLNCTNCGPRFTIIQDLPYDRAATTMAPFAMCPDCSAEYHDPANRRFHAQPNACARCGPHVSLELEGGDPAVGEEALRRTQELLKAGSIVGVKGIGGFHLACDAGNSESLARLRSRKGRIEQPFAVMARDLDIVKQFAEVNDQEARLLSSPARPIVLLQSRNSVLIDALVAPGNAHIGVMLPYAPLHYLLLTERPLVMTSANATGEPIVSKNDEARQRLAGLADALLVHNREIEAVCDDSVIRTFEGREMPVRRSRGYAPLPVRLTAESGGILAVGGELKSTFCVTKGRSAYLSQHIGDMGTLETQHAFETALSHMTRLFRVEPSLVACDLHPGYLSAAWAAQFSRQRGITLLRVQHHHAHVASLAAEAGLDAEEAVLGVAFDGTGYGVDGAIWGGEFLLAGAASFRRLAHLRYTPLPGGDASIKHPARAALAHLWQAGIEWTPGLPCVSSMSSEALRVLRRQLERRLQCVDSSSMGRLFDSISALIGIRQDVSYEGQAAMELEALAGEGAPEDRYRFEILEGDPLRIDPAPLLKAIVWDVRSELPAARIAAAFHKAVAAMIAEVCQRLRIVTGVNTAALTGGVFQNMILLTNTVQMLRQAGFRVLTHRIVPANDAGLSLGQAAIGAATWNR